MVVRFGRLCDEDCAILTLPTSSVDLHLSLSHEVAFAADAAVAHAVLPPTVRARLPHRVAIHGTGTPPRDQSVPYRKQQVSVRLVSVASPSFALMPARPPALRVMPRTGLPSGHRAGEGG